MTGPPLYTMLPLELLCSGRLLFTLGCARRRWRLCDSHKEPSPHASSRQEGLGLCTMRQHLCVTADRAPL